MCVCGCVCVWMCVCVGVCGCVRCVWMCVGCVWMCVLGVCGCVCVRVCVHISWGYNQVFCEATTACVTAGLTDKVVIPTLCVCSEAS